VKTQTLHGPICISFGQFEVRTLLGEWDAENGFRKQEWSSLKLARILLFVT
jgi:hypothetical protein